MVVLFPIFVSLSRAAPLSAWRRAACSGKYSRRRPPQPTSRLPAPHRASRRAARAAPARCRISPRWPSTTARRSSTSPSSARASRSTGRSAACRPNDPFYEFFRRFGQPDARAATSPPARGEGSGFIVSADGYILTNAHVVANADEVTVKTTDRREYTAKVVGADEQHRRRGAQDRREEPADRAASAIRRSCGSANGWSRSARRSASRTP